MLNLPFVGLLELFPLKIINKLFNGKGNEKRQDCLLEKVRPLCDILAWYGRMVPNSGMK